MPICPSLKEDELFLNRYKIIKRLGGGGFGQVYEVEEQTTRNTYALKIEVAGTVNSVLKVEAAIMTLFSNKHKHFAQFIEAGKLGDINYIVMSTLGPDLCLLLKKRPTKRFTLTTTVRIGLQCTEALEDLHNLGYLHRDIKPSNLVLGRPPKHRTIYLIDFGLARKFVRPNKTLRRPRISAPFRGTQRYASCNTHDRIEQGPHDDFISLVYTLIEMFHGKLPWDRSVSLDDNEVRKMKMELSYAELLRGFPKQMKEILERSMSYVYQSIVDYQFYQLKFKQMLSNPKTDVLKPFEWEE